MDENTVKIVSNTVGMEKISISFVLTVEKGVKMTVKMEDV